MRSASIGFLPVVAAALAGACVAGPTVDRRISLGALNGVSRSDSRPLEVPLAVIESDGVPLLVASLPDGDVYLRPTLAGDQAAGFVFETSDTRVSIVEDEAGELALGDVEGSSDLARAFGDVDLEGDEWPESDAMRADGIALLAEAQGYATRLLAEGLKLGAHQLPTELVGPVASVRSAWEDYFAYKRTLEQNLRSRPQTADEILELTRRWKLIHERVGELVVAIERYAEAADSRASYRESTARVAAEYEEARRARTLATNAENFVLRSRVFRALKTTGSVLAHTRNPRAAATLGAIILVLGILPHLIPDAPPGA